MKRLFSDLFDVVGDYDDDISVELIDVKSSDDAVGNKDADEMIENISDFDYDMEYGDHRCDTYK